MKQLHSVHASEPAKSSAPVNLVREVLLQQCPLELIKHVESELIKTREIVHSDELLAAVSHDPLGRLLEKQRCRLDEIEQIVREAGFTAPESAEIVQSAGDGDLLDLLVQSGRVVSLYNGSLKKLSFFIKLFWIKELRNY